jgi:hypothetical protein
VQPPLFDSVIGMMGQSRTDVKAPTSQAPGKWISNPFSPNPGRMLQLRATRSSGCESGMTGSLSPYIQTNKACTSQVQPAAGKQACLHHISLTQVILPLSSMALS